MISDAESSAIRRSGRTRLPRTSDQRPAPIRVPIPSTFSTASATPADAVERPRCSCRKRTRKPTRHAWGASSKLLAAARSQRLGSRSTLCTRGCTASRSASGPSRSIISPSSPPRRQPIASARIAARTPPADRSSGSPSATQAPPIGTAVCRTPSANPRWLAPNQCITARPLAELTLAPSAPARNSSAVSEANDPTNAATPRHTDAAPSPAPITVRSPQRSVARPQG